MKRDHDTVAEVGDPAELAAELKRRRELEGAKRADELARERAVAGHGRACADVAEESRRAELERAEREAEARADAELARIYREFRAAGERTRIRSLMARSGEARALRLDRLRSRNLLILVPLLIGFGIWSTTGVQQGAARLMDVTSGSPVWWVLWGLEALLIGLVCRIIVVRAQLAISGGQLGASAENIAIGCLMLSVFLNLVAAVPGGGHGPHGWAIPGVMFAHAIGPVGAAVTAHLIGAIDKSITDADPWHEGQDPVPRLADMDLRIPSRPAVPALPAVDDGERDEGQDEGQGEDAEPAPRTVWPVPVGTRTVLPVLPKVEDEREDRGEDERWIGVELYVADPRGLESERSAPWYAELPDVRETVAEELGRQVVAGAERYLSDYAEGLGALCELPPPQDERERREHPRGNPDERPASEPPTEDEAERSGAAHEEARDEPGDRRNEQAPSDPDKRRPARAKKPRVSAPGDPLARLAAVRALLDENPDLSSAQIGARLGIPSSTARRLAAKVRAEREQDGGEQR